MAASASHRGSAPLLDDGRLIITGQASELVPTGSFANVTIGPVVVTRVIPDDFDLESEDDQDRLKKEIENVQLLVEQVISEQRGLVEDSIKHHNSKD